MVGALDALADDRVEGGRDRSIEKELLENWRQVFLDFFVLKLVHPNKNLKRLVNCKQFFPSFSALEVLSRTCASRSDRSCDRNGLIL